MTQAGALAPAWESKIISKKFHNHAIHTAGHRTQLVEAAKRQDGDAHTDLPGRTPIMSKLSRISLTPLLALTLGTACDTDQDDQFEDRFTEDGDEDFRTGRGGRYGSGDVLNTNNAGGHFFDHIALSGSAQGLELLSVETAGFDYSGSRPSWEHDDVPAGLNIDDPSGVFDLVVDGSHLLTGTTTGGMFLRHGDFHNSVWTFQADSNLTNHFNAVNVQHDGSGVIEMRLEVSWIHPDGVTPIPPGLGEDSDEGWIAQDGSIPVYTFYYQQNFQDVSTCTAGPGQSYTSAVLYNNVEASATGEMSYTDDLLYVGCLEGAVGKAGGLWGYWPDEVDAESGMVNGDPREHFQAATRMVRADYCGDGNSYTVPGKQLELYDVLGATVHDSTASDYGTTRPMVEAVWDASGAVCLDIQRDPFSGPPSCGIPLCNGKSNAFATMNSASPGTMITRTVDFTEANTP